MAGASDYLEENFFNHMLRDQAFTPPATIHLSLHKGDPLDDDSGANEVSTGSDDAAYARQTIAFAAWAGNQVASNGSITFPTVDAGSPGYTITHFGIYDAATAGNLLWSDVLGTAANPQPKTLAAGNSYSFNTGAVVLTAD
jgi:hypothetical protein